MNKPRIHTLHHTGQRRLTLDGMSLQSRFLRPRTRYNAVSEQRTGRH